jgi:ferric-dicitrate binding protein FerR (iron transport regulator)
MMWRDGLLFLENSTLTETITKLERWYGVKIIINNRPKDKWSANGLFDNEYLDNVLHSLSFSQAFDYEIKGKQVYMTFK